MLGSSVPLELDVQCWIGVVGTVQATHAEQAGLVVILVHTDSLMLSQHHLHPAVPGLSLFADVGRDGGQVGDAFGR